MEACEDPRRDDGAADIHELCRAFVATAVHGLPGPPHQHDGTIPPYLADLVRRQGMALELMMYQEASAKAHAALVLASLSATDEEVRHMCLNALAFSRNSIVDDVLLSAAFDPDPDIRRLALEASIDRESKWLDTVCGLLASDVDPELAQAAVQARNGGSIPFWELLAPDVFGLEARE